MGQQKQSQRIVDIHQGFGMMPTFLFGGATRAPEPVMALGPSRMKLNTTLLNGAASAHPEIEDIFKRIWSKDE